MEPRTDAVTRLAASEAWFLVIAAFCTWFGSEFDEGVEASPWFGRTSFGIPLHYLLFGLLLVALSPYVMNSPRFRLSDRLRRLGLMNSLLAAGGILAFALSIAILRGVPELFADWRNLLVAAFTAIYAAKWLAAQEWKRYAVTDLATLYGLLSIPYLIAYALGGGTTLLGVRTPVFEGTALYLASFAALAAAWNMLHGDPSLGPRRAILLRVAGVAGSLLVLLGFRRAFWLVFGIGLVVIGLLYLRSHHVRPTRLALAAAISGVLVLVTVTALGSNTVVDRLQSFLPSNTGQYSATNEDHVNDLVDAWAIVRIDPILGYGLGRRYETNLIAEWKTESFEVHSAVLHVWLKFGIAGAVVYLWFHLGLARAAIGSRYSVPIGAFLIGQLVGTLFGTWPYGRFQMAIFLGLAIALVSLRPDMETPGRPAERVITAT